MAYCIRVFSQKNTPVSIDALNQRIRTENMVAMLRLESGSHENWDTLLIQNAYQEDIAILSRDFVTKDSLLTAKIAALIDEIQGTKPVTAVKWLTRFLKRVTVVYTFDIQEGINLQHGWEVVDELQSEIRGRLHGIYQADGEGYSNTMGYRILWQFPYDVTGTLPMAVLNRWGRWQSFEMDLGNLSHRIAFLAGKVPKGARRVS